MPDTTTPNPLEHVTMGRPLTPWPNASMVHKILAMHIHQATRPAGHGAEAPNFGLADTEREAQMFDAPTMQEPTR